MTHYFQLKRDLGTVFPGTQEKVQEDSAALLEEFWKSHNPTFPALIHKALKPKKIRDLPNR